MRAVQTSLWRETMTSAKPYFSKSAAACRCRSSRALPRVSAGTVQAKKYSHQRNTRHLTIQWRCFGLRAAGITMRSMVPKPAQGSPRGTRRCAASSWSMLREAAMILGKRTKKTLQMEPRMPCELATSSIQQLQMRLLRPVPRRAQCPGQARRHGA